MAGMPQGAGLVDEPDVAHRVPVKVRLGPGREFRFRGAENVIGVEMVRRGGEAERTGVGGVVPVAGTEAEFQLVEPIEIDSCLRGQGGFPEADVGGNGDQEEGGDDGRDLARRASDSIDSSPVSSREVERSSPTFLKSSPTVVEARVKESKSSPWKSFFLG